METPSSKRRIRHIYHHNVLKADWNKNPRGWINPEGRFHETKEHWRSITFQFKRPGLGTSQLDTEAQIAEGERISQLAYNLGWISIGHAGELNAIGHEKTFNSIGHPAVITLRELLAARPEESIHVELQKGHFNPSLGVHEDYDVKIYDLTRFLKRGRLILPR